MTTFLIGMAWKSALIAGAALLALRLLKDSPAAARAALLQFAALLLLLLPALALLLPPLDVAIPESAAAVGPVSSAPAMAAGVDSASMAASGAERAGAAPDGMILADMLPFLYLAGAGLLLAQLGIGVARLAAWTRAASSPDCPRWASAFARVRARAASTRPARLLVSQHVRAPMSWGWRSAAILIDRTSLSRPDDAPAVIEHEMAHVERGDWPALMLVRIAAALFWFNPLVWLLQREFVQASEEAADARAVRRVEPIDYAQMLLGYAAQGGRSAVPANPVGAHPVGRRIEAILARRGPSGRQGRRLAAAMAGCLAVAAPVAALSLDGDAGSGAAFAAVKWDRTTGPVGRMAAPVMLASMQAQQPPEPPYAPEPPEPVNAPDAPEPPYPPEAPEPAYAPEPPLRPSAPHALKDLDRDIEEAVAAAERAARTAAAEVERAKIEIARIDVEEIRATAMHAAAEGMASGADGMEQGAREMTETARRLRTDPDYRLRTWRDGNRRGEPLSEAEAIELARKMEEGAVKMREGAKEMRRKAAEMRAKQP